MRHELVTYKIQPIVVWISKIHILVVSNPGTTGFPTNFGYRSIEPLFSVTKWNLILDLQIGEFFCILGCKPNLIRVLTPG